VIDKEKESEFVESPSRRTFLEVGSAAIAAAAFAGVAANAQQREDTRKAEGDHSGCRASCSSSPASTC
jgi:hypothetical protein